MKKFLNPKNLGVASLISTLVGSVVITVSEVVSVIRRDKRHKKLYATLQLKAEEMTPNDFLDIEDAEMKE